MDEDTTFLERHLTMVSTVIVGVFVLGLIVQVQSALWAPLQKMFVGF